MRSIPIFLRLLCAYSLAISLEARAPREARAVITAPVVDLCIEYTLNHVPPASPPGASSAGICKRAHQVLFNEVVTYKKEHGLYAEIAIDHLIYGVEEGKARNTFWIPKHKLTFLSKLEEPALVPRQGVRDGSTVVLILPWHGYSVGTRFVRVPQEDMQGAYAVSWFDHQRKTAIIDHIPQERVLVEEKVSRAQARDIFVKVAYDLIDYFEKQGTVVPYVWGGGSCIEGYTDTFSMLSNGAWARPGPQRPYHGYDCSELVFRLAQIAGIPYPYKTTIMLAQFGKALKHNQEIEAGDLLWIPGHVMIIGNNHELLEARGYQSGYGKLQRIALRDSFVGIETVDQLRKAYQAKQPLLRIAKKDGSEITEITDWKIIKLI